MLKLGANIQNNEFLFLNHIQNKQISKISNINTTDLFDYSDSIIYGFSHTHLSGTGVSDYGDILLMPTTGELLLTNGADGKKGYSKEGDGKKDGKSSSFIQRVEVVTIIFLISHYF